MGMKRLRCMNCEMTAGAQHAWLWHGTDVMLPASPTGTETLRQITLWLCPDCAGDLGSSSRCDAFLQKVAKKMKTR
jgi:hypothetical protein